MDTRKDGSPIRILHLSDFHFRAGTVWDSDPMLRALARFLGQEVRDGLAPDLVAITGDLAFSGKAEEYDLARSWLERELWPVLSAGTAEPLPRERLLLVPGNHDANRGQVGKGTRAMQDGLLAEGSQDAIAELLRDERERDLLLNRHGDYLKLYGDWLAEPQTLPWWQRTLLIRGQRVHVAGLDSAWISCGDTDRGRLLLGRWQINRTLAAREAEGADWRIALLHHPWDYLAEFDAREARQTVHLHADLLLRGHLHEGEASLVRPPDPTRACLELAAGSVYDGSRYANAFQWIELHRQPRRVRVLFRLWNKGTWQEDRNQPGCPDGVAEIPLGQDPARPGGPTAAAKAPPARKRKEPATDRPDADPPGPDTPSASGNHGDPTGAQTSPAETLTATPVVDDSKTFDCFLSHNSKDKPAVRELAQALRTRGIKVWLDEEELQPGKSSQSGLEVGIRASRSVAVLVGASGLGPWEKEEQEAAIRLAVRYGRKVIPVLLADAGETPDLSIFLGNRIWADLRPHSDSGEIGGIDRLIWGITDRKPARKARAAVSEQPARPEPKSP